jgi:hypothetical protein
MVDDGFKGYKIIRTLGIEDDAALSSGQLAKAPQFTHFMENGLFHGRAPDKKALSNVLKSNRIMEPDSIPD